MDHTEAGGATSRASRCRSAVRFAVEEVPSFCIGGYGQRVDVQPVDARDIKLEWDETTYRVYVWSQDGGRCDEHELSRAQDVREVLAWAESNVDGRAAEIFARHDHGDERGLIRLAGARPHVA
jgi:hypothetical protein